MPQSDNDAAQNHRGRGWTLWREIYGTFVGVLPLIIAIGGVGYTLVRDNDRHTLEIFYLQQADVRVQQQLTELQRDRERSRTEVLTRIDSLGNKIEELQKLVARNIR